MYDFVGADHWAKTTLYDLARWKNGLAFKNINFSAEGRPVIKIAELKAGITDQTKFTQAEYDRDVMVCDGDMLFSWSGNPDTSIDVFRWEGRQGWLNQHIYKVYPAEGVEEEFLFFLLRSLRPRFAEIARNKQTTGLGHVTLGDFKQMVVGLPSKLEQRLIVASVGPIQKKIELNRRMNETLEAQARALFRDWFVDFGPVKARMAGPDAGGAPYLAPDLWSLFPDRLDDDGVPEGWKVATLNDFAICQNRKADLEEVDEGTPYIGLEHMPRRSIALSEWEGAEKVSSAKSWFRRREILFGKLRPYFHKVGIAPVDGICSTDIVVLAPKKERFEALVLACVSTDEFVAFTDLSSTGTKMPRTSWKIMKTYPMVKPGDSVADWFQAICGPMLDRILSNIEENQTLAQTRDLLLPKLMSGEIRVGAVEREVEKVA
ncbi:restriction endonuclease subunit S [Stakelama tenebrarum]|uniref:Restriction endonuclease subunit S n=1 Tax=Stakelama tenebrarum TaxID=2711215 RepID=A0A6G6Y4W2_9SPHN|nr:restriction endonuclease subunit S [Sphingosinithalassobacter tenebrarum]QIG79643.1 restriction endonuclease subunit S [Sphingosinithalassobacter tenebrarum]